MIKPIKLTFVFLALILASCASNNSENTENNESADSTATTENTDEVQDVETDTPTESHDTITPFEENKTLSSNDLGFLELIKNGVSESARGEITEVTLGDASFKVGQVLTAKDAEVINAAAQAYGESAGDNVTTEMKTQEAAADGSARGCGYYCYYYWWDNNCRCYKYYYYYCCL